jgi:IMP dehydrogenase
MKIEQGFCFDDVILKPKYSEILSRSEVDLSVDLGKEIILQIPIISANMPTVTEGIMAGTIAKIGGLALLHRFKTVEEQIAMFFYSGALSKNFIKSVGCSVGVNKKDQEDTDKLINAGVKIICIDCAHGDSSKCYQMTEWIAKKYPEVLLISGNVAAATGAVGLANCGANIIKIGVGPGSICSTRRETGCGNAQLSALAEVYEASQNGTKYKMIADGGIRYAGDITKSLVFADVVMLGSLLAGSDEAPGNILIMNDKKYKEYSGSSTYKTTHIEGVSGLVPYKGSVKNIITKLMEGLKSGCSYQGVSNLIDLKKDPHFVQITNAGLIESHPHDITIRE